MAKTASDTPLVDDEEALSRRKKQARREGKLMLEIEEANKDLRKAQKKQSKAQAGLQARRTALQRLEAKLVELHAQSLEPASETTPPNAELESQQEPSELESSTVRSDEQISASPHVKEDMVVTNEVTEAPEAAAVQDDEIATATESAPIPTTPRKAPAHKTAAARKQSAKRPASPSTATKRPASRSQSTRQPHSDAE
jgi:hypothetical protein